MTLGQWTHEAFVEQARAFHGYPAPGLIIGGYMVELAKRHMPEGVLYDAISETAHCLPDAVQLLTHYHGGQRLAARVALRHLRRDALRQAHG